MLPTLGRFYVHGTSPKVIVTNSTSAPIQVQLWQVTVNEEATDDNTTVYISFDYDSCTLDKGTPLPEGGTVLRFILPPGQSVYGVSDDQGRGGWMTQPVVVA